jgi:phenylalanyl-tRNA synthetase alpha subunit
MVTAVLRRIGCDTSGWAHPSASGVERLAMMRYRHDIRLFFENVPGSPAVLISATGASADPG